jgi:hypothetical protein
MPDGHLDQLAGHAAAEGVALVPVTDPAHRRVVTTAIAAAAGWQDETATPEGGGPCAEELLVLATTADDVVSRLRAGAAASAVLLAATSLDLATCPLTRLFRVGHTRDRLRHDVLAGATHPQLVLRVGRAAAEPVARSPRRSVDETVTYLPGTGPRRAGH